MYINNDIGHILLFGTIFELYKIDTFDLFVLWGE
jgi:hypothetical protein